MPWIREGRPNSDIVISSRIRLARNFLDVPFTTVADGIDLARIQDFVKEQYEDNSFLNYHNFQYVKMSELTSIEKRVLVEKHLISPHLANKAQKAGALISENEQASIMVNEEDHIRIQLYFPDRKSTRLNSSHVAISYAVFCLKKKKNK